jgi:SAM-dependent methyltransferase
VPDHLDASRRFWDGLTGAEGEYARQLDYGRAQWSAAPNWGDWSVPEAELRLLPEPLAGLDAVELGCGTAYLSGWLARAGARPVGVDASARQLGLARRLQREHGVEFPLVLADGERVPLAGGRFDLVLSEYGASSWCDPARWVPEAARLLRPGGRLVFLVGSPLLALCLPPDGGPAGDRLVRGYADLHRVEVPGFGVEWQLPYGGWVRVLRDSGLQVTGLTELRPPAGACSPWPFAGPEWAGRWPAECVWTARKGAGTSAIGAE